ncbi:hypothetical protein EDB85DRAFT_1967948 [Lactarius pseudohatsudake]|nr:hypothetical protein EDB85DRAFT_1967948 [Lactarius pseudohatsudake]
MRKEVQKAYIEQLERAVTKPQTVLALSPEQVAAPPPILYIRELPKLLREDDELRRQLHMRRLDGHPS